MKRILVVDDDEAFRTALKSCLEHEKYHVTVAPNGKVAESLIGIDDFDTVISDIRMPELSGIELLHFIKRTKPMPVILMTGFAELSETQEAYSLGADEFIAKPFKREDLLEAVKICSQDKLADNNDQVIDDDFSRLSIDDFISGKEIRFDVYIRLSERKYVKIAHEGENIPIDRIKAYKTKKISYLYLKKLDFRKYVGFNLSLAQAVKTSGRVSKIKKMNFMKHTGEVIMENLYTNEVEQESFEDAKTLVETTVGLISEEKDLFDLLNVLNSHSDFLYAHSLGVSLYSVMIGKKMSWVSPPNVFKVATGGLLHDIGKKEINRAILVKARRDLTPEEVRIFESHPTRGAEILGTLRSIPSDVLQIVAQHHENCLGSGYPSATKKKNIHPMARLISTANEFCNFVVRSPQGPGMTPREAIKRMITLYRDTLDPQPFMALMRLFDVEVPRGFGDPSARTKAA